jgi:hypothetical protein
LSHWLPMLVLPCFPEWREKWPHLA